MKTKIKVMVLASIFLLLAVGMTGCVTTNSPTTTPQAQVTAQATVKATVAPTVTNTKDNNIAGIEQNIASKGYVVVTHFAKTTYDGKVAYTGTIRDPDYTYKVTIILTSTQAEAASYTSLLVTKYQAQGFTIKSEPEDYQYILSRGYDIVGVYGYSTVYGTGSPGVAILEA